MSRHRTCPQLHLHHTGSLGQWEHGKQRQWFPVCTGNLPQRATTQDHYTHCWTFSTVSPVREGFFILFCIYQSGVTLRFKHVEQRLTLTAKVFLSLQLEVAVPAGAAGPPSHARLAVALPTLLDTTGETMTVSGESGLGSPTGGEHEEECSPADNPQHHSGCLSGHTHTLVGDKDGNGGEEPEVGGG